VSFSIHCRSAIVCIEILVGCDTWDMSPTPAILRGHDIEATSARQAAIGLGNVTYISERDSPRLLWGWVIVPPPYATVPHPNTATFLIQILRMIAFNRSASMYVQLYSSNREGTFIATYLACIGICRVPPNNSSDSTQHTFRGYRVSHIRKHRLHCCFIGYH
jgi:hypothetical protein